MAYTAGRDLAYDATPGSTRTLLVYPSDTDTCHLMDSRCLLRDTYNPDAYFIEPVYAEPEASGSCAANIGSYGYGYCSTGKPLLPGRGFIYDPSGMADQGVQARATPLVDQISQPGFALCADAPLRFINNTAHSGHGGAVYQGACDDARGARGECFISGFAEDVGGALIEFNGNSAGGAGGAVFSNCDALGPSCAKALDARVGLPFATYTRSIFFRHNSAAAYGSPSAAAASPTSRGRSP
jgi:hypothetical protein